MNIIRRKQYLLKNENHTGGSWLKRIDPALWIFLLYTGIFIGLYKLAPSIIAPLTFGWYLSLIIDVPARFFNRIRVLSHKAAVVISSILMFGLLVLCMVSFVPIAIDEGGKVGRILADYVVSIDIGPFMQKIGISEQFIQVAENSASDLLKLLTSTGVKILNTVLQNLPSVLTGSVLFFITATYFTGLTPVLKKNVWRFFPKSSREKSTRFIAEFYRDIRHFIGGQMLIAMCVGILVGLGLFIVGVPYPLFLGFLAGITNFIPYLGSIITMVPALLLGFTDEGIIGLIKALAVLLVVNQIEVWVLSPKIQGQRMKINWFVILISMFLFGAFFGILGVLLAIPMIVFIRKFWIEYIQDSFSRI
ncbi:MAG: AI-2E family transporter [Spirochaetales bacterium]|nr:AI-2E family transporter [Spirochaetales bacterium]